ncbi:CCR4-NOT transcription complex subunit 2 [Cryptosporidium canis]|uniref:CCR4-NOT transcription complex subunit 2 n=1 Tax=Cryptosporidium canis TaxID=195482 RepID=A0A9D5I039_9CRYT|nr:CCR4-NOT transcription complex subunit 2 [Cryptosporidium canis]
MDAKKQVQKSSSSSRNREDKSPQKNAHNAKHKGGKLDSAQSNKDDQLSLEDILYETNQQAISYNRRNYGLLGILNVIKMADSDLNILALGTDLTTLGLNLNSSECLYFSFDSPWGSSTANSSESEPESELNELINAFANNQNNSSQMVGLKSAYVQKFALETLFYIFYNMPQDLLQGFAAVELCNRGWLYHPESFQWYSKVQSEDGQTNEWETFDTKQWCTTPAPDPSSNNLLSVDDIRPGVEEGVRAHSKLIQEQNQIYQIVQQQLQQQSFNRNKFPEFQAFPNPNCFVDFGPVYNQRNINYPFPQMANNQMINPNNYPNFRPPS